MSIPPLYNSFDENQEAKCVFCQSHTNDTVLYGNKYTMYGVTFHNFCLLFASGLQQKNEEEEEIMGYLVEDVRRELKRASKLTCFYCKLRGASIGCCRRTCRKSFHYTCGLENSCLSKFFGKYDSYCHLHHDIERSTIHGDNELCVLCEQAMGKFHAVTSIELPCCDSRWYHSQCLKNLVNTQAIPRCRTCGDEEKFKEYMLLNGIFIPERSTEQHSEEFNGNDSSPASTSIIDDFASENNTDPSSESTPESIDDAIDDENTDIVSAPARKKQRIHKSFVYVTSYNNEEESLNFIKSENCWSQYYKTKSIEGDRQMFRCNKVKFRSKQCSASIYLLFDSKNPTIHLYRSVSEHDHDSNVNLVYEIPLETKQVIKNMYELGVTKPKIILNNLMMKKIEVPDRKRFDAFLKQMRDEKFGTEKINMVELKQWLQDNNVIPIDKNHPFIVDFEVCLDEKDPYFRFFVSTKQILANAFNTEKLHTDGTYKCIWQGYPVLQIGTTDMYRSYHPFGIAVTTYERTGDYAFIFSAVKKGMKNVYKFDYNPEILISDAAKSIHNGFEEVYGKRDFNVMCWFHMRSAVSDNLSKYGIRTTKHQNELLHDLDRLQLSQNTDIFNKAAKLFVTKWEKVSPEFTKYFDSEWLQGNRYWYEGVRHLTPSTNNALESANRLIKQEHTIRERYDLSRFRTILFEMVQKWSLAYSNGSVEIHNNPEITLKQWTKAYAWAKIDFHMAVSENDGYTLYKIPYDSKVNVVLPDEEWNSFEEFKSKNFKYFNVNFPIPFTKHNWLQGRCDCSDFFKLFMCEHILGIALRMKFVIAPDEAKAIPLGQKRKRGRPARAKAALVLQ